MNKRNAIAFYKMAYEGEPRKAVEHYVGNQYIQHNPVVKDGKEGFIEYFGRWVDVTMPVGKRIARGILVWSRASLRKKRRLIS